MSPKRILYHSDYDEHVGQHALTGPRFRAGVVGFVVSDRLALSWSERMKYLFLLCGCLLVIDRFSSLGNGEA